MSNEISFGRGTLFNFIAGTVAVAAGYVISVVIARFLGPEDFGIYSIATSLVFILSVVLTTGVQQTTSKFISETPKKKEEIKYQMFRIQAGIAVIFFLLYFFASPLVASLFKDQSLVPYVRYGALIIIFQSLFSVFLGYLNGLKRFKQQAGLTLFYAIVRVILMVGLVLLGYSIFGAITGFILATAISLFLSVHLYKLAIQRKVLSTKKVLGFAAPIFLFSLITLIIMYLDLFFVKAFGQANANRLSGYYSAALTFSRIPYYLINPLTVTIFPVISELSHKKNINKQREYISRSLDYSIMMLAFLMFAVAFTAKYLITLFYGAKYLDAALPLTILIFGGTFFSLFLLFTTIIAASGKPGCAFFISGITLVADFVLNYLLVLRYGMLGAAVAATIAMVFGFAISCVYLRRRFGVTVKVRKVAVIIFSAMISCFLFRLLPTNGFWIILSYLACGSAYIALLFLFRVTRRKDIDFVKKLFLRS